MIPASYPPRNDKTLNSLAQGGCPRAAGGGGQPGEQLGVHGDDGVGVEPEGVVRAVGPRAPASQGSSSRAEAWAVADGVQDVRERDHPDAVPDHSRGSPPVVPAAVVERVAECVLASDS